MRKSIPFSATVINDGFWKFKQDLNKNTTVRAVCHRFSDTHRFDALNCRWKEEGSYQATIAWDSDIAKWIEGVAYILKQNEAPELEELADTAIENIVSNADEHGYFNSYYLAACPQERFTRREDHELYCAGHLIEAAVAYYDATGKDIFLKAMCKYADYIEKVFKIDRSASFVTPGHPELELALVRLYDATGEKRYLELSKYFIDLHGTTDQDSDLYDFSELSYNMDEIPLRDRTDVKGHCVRALYLLSGAIDIAIRYNDTDLKDACRRCFHYIINKQMYITGSVGSTHMGEAFSIDYDLPSRTAYTETCAAISLALYAERMQNLEADSIYADIVERAVYNGVLSGISMDGKSFFYENPLEIDPKFNHVNTSTKTKERFPITERVEVFECSCCPPNLVRFIASIADFIYTCSKEALFINQYMACETNYEATHILMKTSYPADSTVHIQCNTDKAQVALRIPGWCQSFRLNCAYEMKDGYAYISAEDAKAVNLTLDMPITAVAANRNVHDTAGRVAIMRGPVVYCIEGVDNGENLKCVSIDTKAGYELSNSEFLLPSIKATGYLPKASEALYAPAEDVCETIPLKLIPYYAFANRGTSEMQVWILKA